MFRPKKIKVFDSQNPEYALVDAINSEIFENYSPEISYWSFNAAATEVNMDELDAIYGEVSRQNVKQYFGPYDPKGTLEINPIIQELTRLGLQQIEEVDLYCNIAAMHDYLDGKDPIAGDIFRITWLETDIERRYIFYSVANVTPVDIYNFRYTNWLINAEQTPLHNVPDEIKLYHEGE